MIRAGQRIAMAAGAIAVTLITAHLALRRRADVARCPEFSQSEQARCCPDGQHLETDGASSDRAHCAGQATHCPRGLELTELGHCVAKAHRVLIQGGEASLGPSDWEAQGVVEPRLLRVGSFWLDSHEVTHQRLADCRAAGRCTVSVGQAEPGLPATGVGPETAEQVCRALGGRLPTLDEWVFAATTPRGFRYPWGQTGLVCRRASFGLQQGPCAHGADGPELAGMRPDGRSETGLFDLAGNVAEWVRTQTGYAATGGSYRSRVAADLKSWASEPASAPARHIGFRCAYERGGAE